MSDNTTLDAGSGGDTYASAELSFSGDTAKFQICGSTILSGSEGSWTQTLIVGGAGAVAAGVQRVTLASDDPAVVDLAAIEVLLTTIDADTSKITVCNTGEVVISSGTVTANLGTTDNAVLDAIAASVAGTLTVGSHAVTNAVLSVVGGGAEATAQRVTIANDSTGLVSVDDNASSLTVDTTGTSGLEVVQVTAADLNVTEASAAAIAASLVTIDVDTSALFGCVAGTEVQVDIVAALPAGTNEIGKLAAGTAAIGKLAANTGVDIGDVDVTSVVPGTAATNLGKARASALGATDTGVAPLAVRNDDLADMAGADGDYTPLQVDNRGALFVNAAAAEPKQASGVAVGGAPGTDDMIAAVASKKLLILALSLFATSVTINTVYVDNADNDLLGNSGNGIALSLDADGDTVAGFVLPYNPAGWFKTDTVNEAVTLNTSAAQDIIYCISYIETD